MTTTTTYDAMASALQRFGQTETAIRNAFTPTANLTAALGRDIAHAVTVTEQVSQQVSITVQTLDGLVRWAGEAERTGRSAQIARLGSEARRITRGNTRISVALVRLLTHLRGNGQTFTADLVAAALLGDADALAYWQGVVGRDDGTALVVLTMLEEIDGMRDDALALAAEVAEVAAALSLTDIPETAEPIPPPRILLAGSIDLCAPPAALVSATAGNVLPGERLPMRA